VSQGVRLAGIGVLLGGVVAWVASQWVEPLLFAIKGRDPLTFAGVILLMLAVAVAASLVPALRAVRADPMQALRAD
jgi:putative ABC transport system permease protein